MLEGRSRKRGHSPDSGPRPSGGGFQIGQHQSDQRFGKRFRADNYNQEKKHLTIEEKITQLGSNDTRALQIGAVAQSVNQAPDDSSKSIVETVCKCIVSFPSRTPHYATLIGLISLKNYPIGFQIVSALQASYPLYLEAQKWEEALTIMHTLACSVNNNVIKPAALLSQFEVLLETTLQDEIPQVRSDYFVYTVLSSLPYAASTLTTQNEAVEQILNTIDIYLNKRSKIHMASIRAWKSTDSTLQMDYLDSLRVQIQNFKANNWEETILDKPHLEKEWKDDLLGSLIPQNYPTIQLPPHSSHFLYPPPRIVFRLFEDDVVDGTKPILGSDKIERFCLENLIRFIIDEYFSNPRVCAHLLNRVKGHDQFATKHLVYETIIGELFALPQTKHHEVVYCSLIREILRTSPDTVSIVGRQDQNNNLKIDLKLNKAIEVILDNLDTMNVTSFERFLNWFTFHLNEQAYMFPWKRWSDILEKSATPTKILFTQEVLSRSIRLTFYGGISKIVGDLHMKQYLQPEPKIAYRPIFAIDSGVEELAATIKKLIMEKSDLKAFNETLHLGIETCAKSEDYEPKDETNHERLLKTDIFTAVILTIASKSLTHISSAIGKYKEIFVALLKHDGCQSQLLQTLQSLLESHPQLLIILVDKFFKAELLDASFILQWIFSDKMRPNFGRCYPWDILTNLISRMLIQNKKSNDTVPTEEEQATDKMDSDDSFVKDTFVDVFSKFNSIIADCSENELSLKCWLIGRTQQLFYSYYNETKFYWQELRKLVEPSMDEQVASCIPNLCQ